MPDAGVAPADGSVAPAAPGAGQAAAAAVVVDKSDPSCRPPKARKAADGVPKRPAGTKPRPTEDTVDRWETAIPYQEGAELNMNGKRVGGEGDDVFEPHPRSTWLLVEERASNTQEWNDVIREAGKLFAKDMPPTRPQLRVRSPLSPSHASLTS